MAFGDLLGTGTATITGITNPFTATAGLSFAVAVGDLIVAVLAEETSLTVSAASDNLGNTYVASNAGSLTGSGTFTSARMFYSRVTAAGTLTSVSFTTTASADRASISVAVFAGPFVVSPVDTNPANNTTNLTSPHACPTTGTLAQALELVVSWGDTSNSACLTGMGVGTFAVRAAIAFATSAIGYTVTAATSSIAHTFTSPSSVPLIVLGTTSFKGSVTVDTCAISCSPDVISQLRMIAY